MNLHQTKASTLVSKIAITDNTTATILNVFNYAENQYKSVEGNSNFNIKDYKILQLINESPSIPGSTT